ncbi:MAG: sigma-70 family RNA polymerase sigma factor [Planctomycetes bacterium]|nr:sigma-70 family RNA polymerase sigma factor [Planctomycetota bacterium]
MPLIGRLRAVALHFVGNKTDADDLVQDTYLRAYERFHLFRQGSNLLAWLSRIAYTQFVNRYHKAKRRKASELFDDEPEFIQRPAGAHGELQGLEVAPQLRESLDQELAQALDRLAVPLREVLVLHAVAEMTYQEIAASQNIPVGTVMSRLFRAREVLRGELSRKRDAQTNGVRAMPSIPDGG